MVVYQLRSLLHHVWKVEHISNTPPVHFLYNQHSRRPHVPPDTPKKLPVLAWRILIQITIFPYNSLRQGWFVLLAQASFPNFRDKVPDKWPHLLYARFEFLLILITSVLPGSKGSKFMSSSISFACFGTFALLQEACGAIFIEGRGQKENR